MLSKLFTSFSGFMRRRGFTVGVLSATLWVLSAGGCAQLAEKERELTFRIEPRDATWFSGLPAEVKEINLDVAGDGKTEKIHGWWWPAEGRNARNAPAVLYLHGARWNLTGHLFRMQSLREFGFSILAIDYRGFGKSAGGLPSEQTVYEDALVAWKHLASLQPDASRRYIYGHSLGGAVAVDLAARIGSGNASGASDGDLKNLKPAPEPDAAQAAQLPGAAGLIVESSFTSLADIARALSYRWLPLQLIMSQKFDSEEKIAKVGMPVLIVHGSSDRYVPSELSQRLFDAATGKKKFLLVEGGSHNNSMRTGADEYRKAFTEVFGWKPSS